MDYMDKFLCSECQGSDGYEIQGDDGSPYVVPITCPSCKGTWFASAPWLRDPPGYQQGDALNAALKIIVDGVNQYRRKS